MKKIRFVSLILCIVCFVCYPFALAHALEDTTKYQSNGPLNIRNQMPMYIFFMAPSPDKAQTLEKGKIEADASYHVSNTIIQQRPWPAQVFPGDGVNERAREWFVYIDTEVNRLDLNISYGIVENLEASIDIPYYIFSDGYLDGFIENFEKTFSFIKTPNAREERESYTFEYEVRNRNKPIIFTTSHPNDFGEVSSYLKYKLCNDTKWLPAISLRGAVKWPTTSDELLGSKKFDYAAGILLDKNLFDRLFFYINLNWVFISRPDVMENMDLFKHHMAHGVFGIEYFLTNKTSMLFQATANTTVYDGGVTSTGRDPFVLTLGFNHNFNDKVSWQIAMDENTNTAAPDFGLFTSLKIKL